MLPAFSRAALDRGRESFCQNLELAEVGRKTSNRPETLRWNMAEGEGFEPPVPFQVQRFSRPPVSTAHTSLRRGGCCSTPIVRPFFVPNPAELPNAARP